MSVWIASACVQIAALFISVLDCRTALSLHAGGTKEDSLLQFVVVASLKARHYLTAIAH